MKKPSRLYVIWRGMKLRCYCQSHKSYNVYGGRGITVCDEWRNSFVVFECWAMSNGYNDKLTIDRKDGNGNYEPSNCRWATWVEQERNRKDNIKPITAFGETKIVCEWLKDVRCKVARSTLLLRIATGRDAEWAMTAPRHEDRRRKPHSVETRKKMSLAAKNRRKFYQK